MCDSRLLQGQEYLILIKLKRVLLLAPQGLYSQVVALWFVWYGCMCCLSVTSYGLCRLSEICKMSLASHCISLLTVFLFLETAVLPVSEERLALIKLLQKGAFWIEVKDRSKNSFYAHKRKNKSF